MVLENMSLGLLQTKTVLQGNDTCDRTDRQGDKTKAINRQLVERNESDDFLYFAAKMKSRSMQSSFEKIPKLDLKGVRNRVEDNM